VEDQPRRHFREAADIGARKDLLRESSPLDSVFDKLTGRFTVSSAELKNHRWLHSMNDRINNKIVELFKWAVPPK
jgi:hypothetical protein